MHKFTAYLVCLLAFMLPWETLGYLGEFPTLIRLVGLACLCVAMVAMLTVRHVRRMPGMMFIALAFWGWNTVSVIWSYNPSSTLTHSLTLLLLLILVWLVWEFCPSLERQLWLMRSYILGTCVLLTLLLLGRVQLSTSVEGARYTGAGHDANYAAELLVVSMLFALYFATRPSQGKIRLRIHYWLYLPVAALAVLLTGSRSGAIAMAAAGVWALFFFHTGRWGAKFLLLLAGLSLLILVPLVVPSYLLTRVSEAPLQAGTLQFRFMIWEKGMQAFYKNPIFGVGGGAFQAATWANVGGQGSPAHSILVNVLVENGIVGITLFLSIMLALVRAAWHMPKRERSLWLGVLLAWQLCTLTAGGPEEKLAWFLFATVIAQSKALADGVSPTARAAGRSSIAGFPPPVRASNPGRRPHGA